uniref:CSON004135 protein n=1 Tax=Culicoides sonorensis TaxID=179676 RepID=A0A336LJ37_CULSO
MFFLVMNDVVQIKKAITLHDVRVEIPRAVERGEDAHFVCRYSLDSDQQLYAVKWYKGRREFYRFQPNEIPPIKTFEIPGISVFRSVSNATHLTLRAVEPTISGKYSCEVSADAPSFDTMLVTGEMDVIELPRTKPKIADINNTKYRVGDALYGNCTSFNSRPAANLTWLINNITIEAKDVQLDKIKNETTKLETVTLSLFVHLKREHFTRGGKAKIQCVAKMFDAYMQSDERIIEEDRGDMTNMIDLYGPIGASLYDSDTKDAFMTHYISKASSPSNTLTNLILTCLIFTRIIISVFMNYSSILKKSTIKTRVLTKSNVITVS